MLQHSRAGSGQKEPTDINKLADEYVRLAYHGLRARDKSFNSHLKTDFDNSIGKINAAPQEIGRVVLNLINNAFYAVNEKQKQNVNGYEPTVTITTAKQNGKIDGILIDLRRNPGGLLEQAIKVSDLFIKEGVIVSTIGRDPKNKEVNYASKKAQFSDVPIVVLINEYSASASEIVAGALQDNKRAVIVGERSFGKGSVQSAIKLSDGSALKLTVARYYTPSGISIQSEGIKPDIEIEDVNAEAFAKAINKTVSLRERDMTGHLKGEKEKQAEKNSNPNKDLQSNTVAWWNDIGSKKDNELSEKDRLFKNDYQAYQAFSYLKAWRTLKSMNN